MNIKHIYSAFLLLGGLSLTACNDFLDERPQTDFTAEATPGDSIVTKYATIADARTELLGAYNSFKNDIFQQENFMINDVQSDNCYVGGDGTNESAVDIFKDRKSTRLYSSYANISYPVFCFEKKNPLYLNLP